MKTYLTLFKKLSFLLIVTSFSSVYADWNYTLGVHHLTIKDNQSSILIMQDANPACMGFPCGGPNQPPCSTDPAQLSACIGQAAGDFQALAMCGNFIGPLNPGITAFPPVKIAGYLVREVNYSCLPWGKK